jgi:hypothetical protein
MADQLPPPPVPADSDLRGMDFMPLKGDRLFDSVTWIEASPEGRCAALRLWWHAFAKELPAGSLPDNDRLLSVYAGYGESVRAWKKVKLQALRGWFLAADGRLYHKVVAEIVCEAWDRRLDHRGEIEAKNERQRRWRERLKKLSNALRAKGIPVPRGAKMETLEKLCRDAGVDISDIDKDGDVDAYVDGGEIGKTGTGTETGKREGQGKEVIGEEGTAASPDGANAPNPPPADQPPPAPPEHEDDPYPPLAFDRSPEAEALNLWNAAADRVGWPKAQRLTDTRRRALKLRLSECGGLEGWSAALAKAEASSFLTGKSGRTNGHENWRCDLDFILRQAKFTKLLEGGFDDPADGRRQRPQSNSEALYRGAMSVAGTKPLKGILDP